MTIICIFCILHGMSVKGNGFGPQPGSDGVKPDADKLRGSNDIMRALSLIFANCLAYGLAHAITTRSIQSCNSTLQGYHQRHGDLDIEIKDGNIAIAGVSPSTSLAPSAALTSRLRQLGSTRLLLRPGLSTSELTHLSELLFLSKDVIEQGNLAERIAAASLEHVASEAARERRHERQPMARARVSVRQDPRGSEPASSAIRRRLPRQELAAIAAGRLDAGPLRCYNLDDPGSVEDLRTVLLEEAVKPRSSPDQMTHDVVCTLETVLNGLLANPDNRSGRSRLTLRHMIEDVESTTADKLMMMGDKGENIQRLAAAIAEMVNSIAGGAMEVPKTLSTAPPPDRPAPLDGPATLDRLRLALGGPPGAASAAVRDTEQLIALLVKQIEEGLENLLQVAQRPASKTDDPELTRQQLLEMMAELGQELRQPLTIVSGVLDMLRLKHAGPLAKEQQPLVEMAVESTQRMDTLVGRMVEIAGMPKTLHPDREILKQFQ